MIRQPRWSCKFSPTPGSSCTMSIPCSLSKAAGPTPDNCNSCGDKGVVKFVPGAQIGDVERAALAVIIVGAALLVLGAAEIRQHVVIAPAEAAELAPIVEILFLAADVDQAVDRGGAAEHLAARP